MQGSPDTYTGTTVVTGGTLVLKKTSTTTDGAIPGDLVIGIVGPGPATVLLELNNQIQEAAGYEITVGPVGVLNLGGLTDIVGPLVMDLGLTPEVHPPKHD